MITEWMMGVLFTASCIENMLEEAARFFVVA
jgi:hypothetical protein